MTPTAHHRIPGVAALILLTALITVLPAHPVAAVMMQARDQIRITGSSTLYPFATAVSEDMGSQTAYDAPIVEGIGSGSGIQLFCAGIGTRYPDIVNASRPMQASEFDLCQQNGVTDIVEIKVGYDGIVLANTKSAPPLTLSLRDIYLALAAQVPAPGTEGGRDLMIPNPYRSWQDIRSDLPDTPITVLGPPSTSGTRDAFNALAMEGGCTSYAGLARLQLSDRALFRSLCRSLREDGVYTPSGENDSLIVQKLQSNWNAVGIFGFSFLDQNSDILQPFAISRGGRPPVNPTFDSIADGVYPVYRALYIYVKKAHVNMVPGIPEYLALFTSDAAWGDLGYLVDRGLIPLGKAERTRYEAVARLLTPMDRPGR